MGYVAFNNIAVDVRFKYTTFPVESETKLTY